MNAKEYGIPQSRNRVFFISTLDKIDNLNIPKTDLLFEAKDILENEVEEKYYLTDKKILSLKRIGSAFEGQFKPKNINDFVVAKCLLTEVSKSESNFIIINNRIRRLTPLECWRLMGWSVEDFQKVSFLSDTQLYKQAGNSIVVQVLEKILKSIYKEIE